MLEIARAMMFTTSVPNSYWGEAILTSAYLINHLPSKILKFRTSLAVLLDVFPHHARVLNSLTPRVLGCIVFGVLNSLTPRVFGCTVFVHQNPSTPSKLDPKAIKCIFVGYSSTQGYKCYNPSTHKFVVSYDVSFLENQPFFQPHSQPAHVPETATSWNSLFLDTTHSLSLPTANPNHVPEFDQGGEHKRDRAQKSDQIQAEPPLLMYSRRPCDPQHQ